MLSSGSFTKMADLSGGTLTNLLLLVAFKDVKAGLMEIKPDF